MQALCCTYTVDNVVVFGDFDIFNAVSTGGTVLYTVFGD
jgi:hypothetical protein